MQRRISSFLGCGHSPSALTACRKGQLPKNPSDLSVGSVRIIPAMHLVILHIEDNPSDAHLMRAHLEDAKLQDAVEICVEQVTCLADALETLKRQPFNVILLDLHLHDSSGMDTLKALVKAMPVVVKVPIVVLSGSINDLQDVEECLANGAADALDKNFITPHSLLRTLIKVRMRANQEETAEDEILADLQDAVAKIEAIRSRINATDPGPGPGPGNISTPS